MSVIEFKKNRDRSTIVDVNHLLLKIYLSKNISNVLHQLIMTVDRIIQAEKYEFKSEGDRDFIKDMLHQYLARNLVRVIKVKDNL